MATLAERAPAIPAGASFAELGTPHVHHCQPRFLPDRRRPADSHPDRIGLAAADPRHGRQGDHPHLADLMSRPLVERTITLTCVSNPVGGNLISTANFIGVELRPILIEAGIQPGAQQLFTTSIDGWNTSTTTDVVLEPDRGALLAIGDER